MTSGYDSDVSDTNGTSRNGALVGAAALFFVVGLMIAAWSVQLPLIAYSPGPITDAVDSVVVRGAPVHQPDGELVMLTVASQDINAFEALVAAVDPSVDVLARRVVRDPDESDEEYRRRNLTLMDRSTTAAISVALDHVETDDYEPGVFITGYAADTPAGQVLDIGDRILSLAGEQVSTLEDLSAAMGDRRPGDEVTIEVERDGDALSHDVELIPREDEPATPMIGILVRQLPFWLDIDSGIVGGPSAGLMYTLAIIDVLTPGDLTGGRIVAGTGAIDADGNVGGVGGVRQKVVAAEAAGAEVMLVPESNHEAALTAPRDDLILVPVATVGDALEFLESLTAA